MKTLSVANQLSRGNSVSLFESARGLAHSLAESDAELIEPELIAWIDRTSALVSPVLQGSSESNGWHEYGVSHGGLLEIDVGGDAAFIFTESSPFDSYEHFGPGPYINIRDANGREMICMAGGKACELLDELAAN